MNKNMEINDIEDDRPQILIGYGLTIISGFVMGALMYWLVLG